MKSSFSPQPQISKPGALVLLSTALSLGLASPASGRGFRPSQIPQAPDSCDTCHTEGGGSPRNDFGLDVEATLEPPLFSANVDWSAVFDRDSDGDGFTNGEELGDPDGTWRIGDPDPDAPAYAPGDADEFPECGNGVLDPAIDEACDGTDFGGFTCPNGGEPTCTGTCEIDDSTCDAAPPDGGVDGGTDGGTDSGGAPDAGGRADTGGLDAGTLDGGGSGPDAGSPDGPGAPEEDDGGCRSVPAPSLALALVTVGFVHRCARRRRGGTKAV